MRDRGMNGVELLCVVMQEVERGGASASHQIIEPSKVEALALLCAIFITTVVFPYQSQASSKPRIQYLIIGVLYLLSMTSMGSLHIPMLRQNMPEEKILAKLDFSVTSVTQGKRYAQTALGAYMQAQLRK